MDQKRGDVRKGCFEILEFTVTVFKDNRLRFVDLSGLAINMSRCGICFITRYPLNSGHVIKFKKSIGRYGHGVVMWIQDLGDRYIAGASLVDETALA
ncbi:MAG: hypothetical protein Q8K68_08710 [Nitrospirota bacterium]|nr:hypothetical protein [Nitrospirota bacterium]